MVYQNISNFSETLFLTELIVSGRDSYVINILFEKYFQLCPPEEVESCLCTSAVLAIHYLRCILRTSCIHRDFLSRHSE